MLRFPLAKLRQSATILDLETYSWRPPWIRYKLGNFGGMDSNGEICGDRANKAEASMAEGGGRINKRQRKTQKK